MELYIVIGVAFLAALVFFVAIIVQRPDSAAAEYEEGHKDCQNMVSLSGFQRPRPVEGVGVYGILLSVSRSLRKQGAAGYGCWISTCIEKIQGGEDVPPETALIALRWTRDELSILNGRRYDLNELGRGILALEVETGEWG